MNERDGIEHILKNARGDGKKLADSITSARVPSGYRQYLGRFNAIKENPNIDFRFKIYDPILDRAKCLVKSYGDDYHEIRKQIEKENYKDLIQLTVDAMWDYYAISTLEAVSPSAIKEAPPWALSPLDIESKLKYGYREKLLPGVSAVESATKLLSNLSRGIEFKFYTENRKVDMVFWLLLDGLAHDLSGAASHDDGSFLRIRDMMYHEAEDQMKWDDAIEETPKNVIEEIFNDKDMHTFETISTQEDLLSQSANPPSDDNMSPWDSLPTSRLPHAHEKDSADQNPTSDDDTLPWDSLPTSRLPHAHEKDSADQNPTSDDDTLPWDSLPTSRLPHAHEKDSADQNPTSDDDTLPWDSLPTSRLPHAYEKDSADQNPTSDDDTLPWDSLPTSRLPHTHETDDLDIDSQPNDD